MAYVKKNLTPEQRAAIGRYAASCVKHHNGGRKKGIPNSKPRTPMTSMCVPIVTRDVFSKLAGAQRMTLCDFLRLLAEMLRQANPAVFEAPVKLPIDGVAAQVNTAGANAQALSAQAALPIA